MDSPKAARMQSVSALVSLCTRSLAVVDVSIKKSRIEPVGLAVSCVGVAVAAAGVAAAVGVGSGVGVGIGVTVGGGCVAVGVGSDSESPPQAAAPAIASAARAAIRIVSLGLAAWVIVGPPFSGQCLEVSSDSLRSQGCLKKVHGTLLHLTTCLTSETGSYAALVAFQAVRVAGRSLPRAFLLDSVNR